MPQRGEQLARRGPAARIGICLLNLPYPGLGLIRLGHYRVGLVLLGTVFTTLYGVLAYYAWGPLLTVSTYLALVLLVLTAWLAAYGAAFVLTWRRSRLLEVRSGWLWRWFGVVGIVAGLAALAILTPDFRTYYGSFYAASGSMLPTLQPGDRFIADMRGREPLERGDIIVFPCRARTT